MPARTVFSVSSTSFPDGGEVPMKNAGRGENKSPAFEFHWTQNNQPATPPEGLQSYAIVFHDIENAGPNRTTIDTLHWTAFNIPGTAKGFLKGSVLVILRTARATAPASSPAAAHPATLVPALAPARSITTSGSSMPSTPSSICLRTPRATR